MDLEGLFNRHQRVALQFSGGKESLAVLYLLKDYWPRLTVYYCNPGAAFPETLELMERIKALVPHFVMVKGRQPEVIAEYGFPSDLVPASSTTFGQRQAGDTSFPLLERYNCCALSIMAPLHTRMYEDGITLIIRGQRASDSHKAPIKSGDSLEGFEFFFPLEDWSEKEVFSYLKAENITLPRYYQVGLTTALDCMNCTAWLEHKQTKYLRKFYPEENKKLLERLALISKALAPTYTLLQENLNKESA